ncbi:T9SS type A sorting domain-containing protein [Ichthyenterobacterium magnum]|uniref:Putative secreted protein (Por secretion system target) n=1 Tax=Ichthyenterobacterium magnum TaxID=1230530 RepID=A0A420DV64_9FLAO|nr:T9SS type A sorting domain-containing protein [Ichthyenterobacterium magnum]RKE98135.1 putative secreted protein (Por secretion system target) [Ichthyenterobacterium magnum]
MKTLPLTIILFALVQLTKAQNINIPNANFKNALLNTNCVDTNGDGNYDSDADTNDDGEIQISEAENVISLNISFNHIDSLEGIDQFTNLEELSCNDNRLISLDVTQNINLKKLYCFNNQILYLNISQNLNLKTLDCHTNQLTGIDISNNTQLVNLLCYSNLLQYLNTSNNINLEVLNCWGNRLLALDFTQNTNLNVLFCYLNQLTSLNLKNGNNTALNIMWAQVNNNLSCIEVDSVNYPASNEGWIKSDLATYSQNCSTLKIDDFEKELQIAFYPNPVEAILNINTSTSVTIKSIKIYDTYGKLMTQENSQFNSIAVSHLSKGFYLVDIETNKGSITKKIIKK